jgi:hypothetical protein
MIVLGGPSLPERLMKAASGTAPLSPAPLPFLGVFATQFRISPLPAAARSAASRGSPATTRTDPHKFVCREPRRGTAVRTDWEKAPGLEVRPTDGLDDPSG